MAASGSRENGTKKGENGPETLTGHSFCNVFLAHFSRLLHKFLKGAVRVLLCVWLSDVLFSQKNPRVRKIFVRNSGAGNGCANFMDAWKNAFFLQEKTMSIKFLVLGGRGYFGFGGGSADFIFMGAGIFLIL